MRIVFIGMRGSGKSTLGEVLSRKLGWRYVETDRIIEKEAGLKISEIVSLFGWKKFRTLESIVIRNLKNVERAVIATGGGVVLNEENMKILKNNSITVFLNTSIPILIKRCSSSQNRPFLTDVTSMKEDLTKTLSKRQNLYEKYADLIILNENKSVLQTMNEFLLSNIYCIIGHPVAHSLSPAMHNAAYKILGLNCHFLGFDVTDLKSCVESIRDLEIGGVAVTIPHKIKIMGYLDKIDNTAKTIGAVNTIINQNGILTGLNTDWSGAINALKEKTSLSGKKVALIGAGGAARAIAYGLYKEGAIVSVFNRTLDHARSLSKDLKLDSYYPLSASVRIKDFDIVINATSVGMIGKKSPVSKDAFSPKQIVFDIVYSPRMTTFLKMAKESGCSIITGQRMLIHCVRQQFELFTGQKAPIDVLKKTIKIKN